MASTFTNNLLLENATPLDPAQRNVWGTTENTGRTLVDAAVAGIQPLNLPAQTGYPTVILTSSQGQPDQARNAHFVFSGTLTANTLVLFPQSRNRMFTVNNTATGAFTATVGVNNGSGAAAGTTVVVPQGQSVNLFSDGTNVATRVNGVVGGLSVDTLTVSGSATYPNPTVGGAANAIALTYPVTPAGNVQGAKYAFKATAANTGATTVAINGGTAKNIFKKTATGAAACVGGEIQNGDIVEIEYDGTQYQIMNGTVGLSGPTSAVSGNIATFNGTSGSAIQDSGVSLTVLMPTGAVLPFAGTAAPSGWLVCNGQVVSRTTYATLFTAIGTAFGAGDGSTTFSVPDMRGRAPAGADAMMGSAAAGRLGSGSTGGITTPATLGAVGGEQGHTLSIPEMPSHAHNARADGGNYVVISNDPGGANALNGGAAVAYAFSAVQPTGGGAAHNNVQPTLVLNYIIKT